MKTCQTCHHRPSERLADCGGYVAECYCDCHKVADAAPDLLTALREAREYVKFAFEVIRGPDRESVRGCLDRIDVAIAKAEGSAT